MDMNIFLLIEVICQLQLIGTAAYIIKPCLCRFLHDVPNLTGQNNPNVGIVLGDKGTNQLKITNTPVRDFAVIKKWKNALGEDLSDREIPVDRLQIKIKQTRKATIGNDVVSKESYVLFNGSDTLNLTKDNSANNAVLVAQTHPGNSDDAQTYNATITDDTNIGKWALYLSGLEEGYYDEDGNLWTCNSNHRIRYY